MCGYAGEKTKRGFVDSLQTYWSHSSSTDNFLEGTLSSPSLYIEKRRLDDLKWKKFRREKLEESSGNDICDFERKREERAKYTLKSSCFLEISACNMRADAVESRFVIGFDMWRVKRERWHESGRSLLFPLPFSQDVSLPTLSLLDFKLSSPPHWGQTLKKRLKTLGSRLIQLLRSSTLQTSQPDVDIRYLNSSFGIHVC